jgi:hypothetical protein
VYYSGKGQGNEHHQVHNLFHDMRESVFPPLQFNFKGKNMLELLLLPWVLFKYAISLILWVGLFMFLHYRAKKLNIPLFFAKVRKRIRNKGQKGVNDDLDDYYNNL